MIALSTTGYKCALWGFVLKKTIDEAEKKEQFMKLH
jgi:hypothetical protein